MGSIVKKEKGRGWAVTTRVGEGKRNLNDYTTRFSLPIFTTIIHVILGALSHSLSVCLTDSNISPFTEEASSDLHWTCPNHLQQSYTSLSSIGINIVLSFTFVFITIFFLILPYVHHLLTPTVPFSIGKTTDLYQVGMVFHM